MSANNQIDIKEFKESLEAEYGTGGYPALTRETLFNLAWDYGHAHGKEAVRRYYNEMMLIALYTIESISLQ